jgi:hypothetical protein
LTRLAIKPFSPVVFLTYCPWHHLKRRPCHYPTHHCGRLLLLLLHVCWNAVWKPTLLNFEFPVVPSPRRCCARTYRWDLCDVGPYLWGIARRVPGSNVCSVHCKGPAGAVARAVQCIHRHRRVQIDAWGRNVRNNLHACIQADTLVHTCPSHYSAPHNQHPITEHPTITTPSPSTSQSPRRTCIRTCPYCLAWFLRTYPYCLACLLACLLACQRACLFLIASLRTRGTVT